MVRDLLRSLSRKDAMSTSDQRHAAVDYAWRSGRLRYLLKRQPLMVEAYDAFRADEETRSKGRIWYWSISRQFGKSYSLVALALEECLRRPGAEVKYASVDQKMCRAIVFPAIEKQLADCPKDLRPQFRSQDGLFYFPNGSRLTVAGVDRDNVKKLRGQHSNLCLVDEGGFMGNLQQVVFEIFLPQTTGTKGRVIVATTPPDSAGHYAAELYHSCKSRGASANFTLWENSLITEAEKQEIVREYGGVESTRFRREYLTEFVTDVSNAVVPEFTAEAEKDIVRDHTRPVHYDALVCLDGGFTDPAGCLFAHVDYARAKLVIEDEWVKKGVLTADIAEYVCGKESELWGSSDLFWTERLRRQEKCASALRRIMDVDPEKAYDFKKNHGMDWTPAQKGPGSVQVSANHLNGLIRSRSIEINPRCVNLIRQLHNATWAGHRTEDGMTPRKTFSRNSTDGHFDLIAAAFYMLPFVDWSHNPSPPPRHDVNMYYTEDESGLDESEDALANAFRQPSGDDS